MLIGSKLGVLASATLLFEICAFSQQIQGQEGPERIRVRVNHPNVVVTVSEASLATYENVPIFEVFFPTHDSSGTLVYLVTVPDPEGEVSPDSLNVFLLHPLVENPSTAITLEECVLAEGSAEACEEIQISTRIFALRTLLEIQVQQPVDWSTSLLRLRIPPGILRLDRSRTATGAPNPGITTVLPVLSEKDLQYVESRPVLKFEVSPLTRDTNTKDGEKGREAVAFDFDGGMFGSGGEQRYGVTWTGHVATEDELSFNQLALNLEYERNLQPGSFMPLVVALSVEADQDLDVVDSSARLELRFLLPFSVNLSPYHDFVPALGPKIKLIGSLGRRLRGIHETVDESFWRLGYEVRWKIPLSSNSILRLHHAGLHDGSDSPHGDEFHSLWDVLLQTQIDELTYFLGFQEGEAAPLFHAIETIRAGVVVSFQ